MLRIFGRKSDPVPDCAPNGGFLELLAGANGEIGEGYLSQMANGLAKNPYVLRCVELRASACASPDPIIYGQDDQPIKDRHDPLYELLRNPAPGITWEATVHDLQTHLAVNGNAYLYIERGVQSRGGIAALRVIPPDRIQPMQSNDLFSPVSYWTINRGVGTITAAPEDIIHIRTAAGSDGILGISPMRSAALAITAQTEAREWNTALMKNGAKPSMTITTDRTLTKQKYDELKSQLRMSYGGTSNTGKVALFDEGLKVAYDGFSAKDMDYTAGMAMMAREISIAWGVPSALLTSAEMTYSNLAEGRQDFAIHTVTPLLTQMYDAISTALCKDGRRIGYDLSQVDGIKGDETAKMTAANACEYLTVNEKRAMFGYDPVPDGDVILTAMGKVTLSETVSDIDDTANDNRV